MNTAVITALKRLHSILPLASGLQSLGGEDAVVYCKLIDSYARLGRALTRQEVGALVADPEQALDNIVASKLIVLDADGNPAGAYPFTSTEREHKVLVRGVTVHCMCALDALAVSTMFDTPTVIDSQCRASGKIIHIEQNNTALDAGTLDAWFGINWGAAKHDIACAESLCMDMIFLANESVARKWADESPGTHEIFDLPSAVDFAAGFFAPLADRCRLTT